MWDLKNKLVNIVKKKKTDSQIENELVLISGDGRGEGKYRRRGKRVIMGLYEIMCVKI